MACVMMQNTTLVEDESNLGLENMFGERGACYWGTTKV